MKSPFSIIAAYRAHRGCWDDLCERCGRCCYERSIDDEGDVVIDYSAPCEFLDEETRRCTVYAARLETCDRCHKLTLRDALFARHLPPDCAYVRAFRG